MNQLVYTTSLLRIALVAALALPACSTRQAPAKQAPAQPGAAAADQTTQPIDVLLRAVVVKGSLEARSKDGAWQRLAAADDITQVTELRAGGKGAIIIMGGVMGGAMGAAMDQGRDTLWLRGGTHVVLARARDGVLVDLRAGRLRISSSAIGVYARTRHARVDLSGRDALLLRRDAGADLTLAYTHQEPERAAWSLELEGKMRPAGIGAIEVAADASTSDAGRALLELRSMDIRVQTEGDYALTEVEHVFYNPSQRRLEGTFRFPLPEGAMPLGLAMDINGRMMEGEIVERDKARKTYESIVDSMQDPALLEWQEGNRFQLRVFPIEPTSEKRVVLRYAAPLTAAIDGWEYVYATAAPDMQATIPRFRLRFDGRTVLDRSDFTAGEDVIVPVPNRDVPRAVREVIPAREQSPHTAGTYTAVRLAPDWSRLATADTDARSKQARALLVIMDTSRSALEGRELGLEILELLLGDLGPDDRFLVMAADLDTRLHAPDFVAAEPDAARAAVDFVRAIEPDGASDIGAAFAGAADLAARARPRDARLEVVYIGDGAPTWGITDPDALGRHIQDALGAARVHAAIIGKGASATQWQRITARRTGRVARPRTAMDARRFAFLVAHSATTPRIDDMRIAGTGSHTAVFPAQPRTLYRGDELVAVMRTPPGDAPPAELTLEGSHAGQPFAHTIRVFAPAEARLVSQRWAARHITDLEARGADKDRIVAASKDFGVMSKHTSLLVLESEEAYEQHNIERRAAQNTPRVTGGDLESLGRRSASLSPDHIQPGDPEIRIPAPADARTVVVIFPFGDTKLAAFDERANAWIARFLIDKDTPDGAYTVLVKVTHADGRVQTYRLPYYVDTQAPRVNMTFAKQRDGSFMITAEQVVTAVDMAAAPGRGPSKAEQAQIVQDARRVELMLPGGRVVTMRRRRPGVFRRRWKPASAQSEPVSLRVVVTDKALNQSTFAVIVHPDGSTEVTESSVETPEERPQ